MYVCMYVCVRDRARATGGQPDITITFLEGLKRQRETTTSTKHSVTHTITHTITHIKGAGPPEVVSIVTWFYILLGSFDAS